MKKLYKQSYFIRTLAFQNSELNNLKQRYKMTSTCPMLVSIEYESLHCNR